MANDVARKMRIGPDEKILTIHAPDDFKKTLAPPPGVAISDKEKNYSQIHWFVTNKAQLEKEVEKIIGLLKPGVVCWIYYPKGTSKIQTDLTRDKGWDSLLDHKELHWISLIAFDETWSAFAMRLKTESDKKKEAKPKERPIFDWVDPVKKTVKLPEDFEKILNKNKKEKAAFESLSFTNKKEYLEWIVTAKREETRNERLKGSIERLAKGWKNPAGRN